MEALSTVAERAVQEPARHCGNPSPRGRPFACHPVSQLIGWCRSGGSAVACSGSFRPEQTPSIEGWDASSHTIEQLFTGSQEQT